MTVKLEGMNSDELKPICSCGEEILSEYWEDGRLIRVHSSGKTCTFSSMAGKRDVPYFKSRFS